MNIRIQSIHFDADQKLIQFIEKKVEKLQTISAKLVDGEVYLKIDKSDNGLNKIAEIKINVPGAILFAKEQCSTFEEATDLAVESLKKQLVKAKEKEKLA